MEAIRRSPWSATAEVEREEGSKGRPRRPVGFVLAGREGVWMSLVRRMLTLGDVPVELVRCWEWKSVSVHLQSCVQLRICWGECREACCVVSCPGTIPS